MCPSRRPSHLSLCAHPTSTCHYVPIRPPHLSLCTHPTSTPVICAHPTSPPVTMCPSDLHTCHYVPKSPISTPVTMCPSGLRHTCHCVFIRPPDTWVTMCTSDLRHTSQCVFIRPPHLSLCFPHPTCTPPVSSHYLPTEWQTWPHDCGLNQWHPSPRTFTVTVSVLVKLRINFTLHVTLTRLIPTWNWFSLSQSSGAVWKSRWPSWAPVPDKLIIAVCVCVCVCVCV